MCGRYDAAGGEAEVALGINNAGRLAAELKRDRGQVLGGRRVDDAPDGRVARVKDVVPVLGKECRRLGNGPLYDRAAACIEVSAEGHECVAHQPPRKRANTNMHVTGNCPVPESYKRRVGGVP